jgi:hypothetical protein
MAAPLTSKQPEKEKALRKTATSPVPGHLHSLKKRLCISLLLSLMLFALLSMFLTSTQILRPQLATCTELLRTADYGRAIQLHGAYQQMAAVQLVDNLVGSSQAALVQVTQQTGEPALDIYVFGCTLRQQQPMLTRLFTRQRLVQGTVEVTPEHTLLTRALDTRLPASLLPFLQPLQQNIYCEYAWRAYGFVQIPFPGLYPVTSRAEADALQQSAESGQTMPWSDPVTTAWQMSQDLLQWSPAAQTRVLTRTAQTTMISLTRQNPHVMLLVTLKQLPWRHRSRLWFVTDVRSRGIMLTSPGTLDQPLATFQRSPIQLGGASALVDGQASATLFDHTLTPISQASSVALQVERDSRYAGTIRYTNLASGQQGVLLIASVPRARNFSHEAGQLLLRTVILT